MLGEHLAMKDAVLKMLTMCSGVHVRVDQFAAKKGVPWKRGRRLRAKVTVQDRFAALTRGFEVVLWEYARAGSFLQELRGFRQLPLACAAVYQNVPAGELGLQCQMRLSGRLMRVLWALRKGSGL